MKVDHLFQGRGSCVALLSGGLQVIRSTACLDSAAKRKVAVQQALWERHTKLPGRPLMQGGGPVIPSVLRPAGQVLPNES